MNKILFCGAGYGAGNVGDDAILDGLLVSARVYLREDTQYGVLTFDPSFTKQNVKIDQAFNFESGVNAAFTWATHIVLGGGSLLSGWSIEHCSGLIHKANVMDKPICMLAAGASVTPTDHQKELLVAHFGSLDMITLRSKEDRDLAIEWGLNSERLYICADGAFAIDHKSVSYSPEDLLGINLVNEMLVSRHSYLHTVAAFVSKQDMRIYYICGEMRKGDQFDYTILKGLHDQFGGELFCEYVNYIDLLKQLARCKVVVTMRMHIMIFCSLIGVPCIPIIREPKMAMMADSLGLYFTLSLDEPLTSFTDVVNYIFDNPELAIADEDKVNALKDRAIQNGNMLCRWMRKEII